MGLSILRTPQLAKSSISFVFFSTLCPSYKSLKAYPNLASYFNISDSFQFLSKLKIFICHVLCSLILNVPSSRERLSHYLRCLSCHFLSNHLHPCLHFVLLAIIIAYKHLIFYLFMYCHHIHYTLSCMRAMIVFTFIIKFYLLAQFIEHMKDIL